MKIVLGKDSISNKYVNFQLHPCKNFALKNYKFDTGLTYTGCDSLAVSKTGRIFTSGSENRIGRFKAFDYLGKSIWSQNRPAESYS